jgi:hypothetical protein
VIHRYEDAAFLQDFLLHNINSRGYMHDLINSFQEIRHKQFTPGLLSKITAETLHRADPIYVSDDVMALWERASETFKLEKLTRHDLVVPAGFAVLPRPFTMTDYKGKAVKYRVIAWLPISARESQQWDEGVEGQGVWLTLLSNVNDIDDYWSEQHKMSDGTSGATLRDLSLAAGQEWTLMHGSVLVFGEDLSQGVLVTSAGDRVEGEQDRAKAAAVYAHVQCFWRLMSQLVMTPEPLPRQARRQRQRAQRIDTVKVLHLRRYRHKNDHEGPGVEYSHRFIVEGHWRNQPYGPRANPEYKQIWISPYVKGPEDKPLVIKKRGVEFDR